MTHLWVLLHRGGQDGGLGGGSRDGDGPSGVQSLSCKYKDILIKQQFRQQFKNKNKKKEKKAANHFSGRKRVKVPHVPSSATCGFCDGVILKMHKNIRKIEMV